MAAGVQRSWGRGGRPRPDRFRREVRREPVRDGPAGPRGLPDPDPGRGGHGRPLGWPPMHARVPPDGTEVAYVNNPCSGGGTAAWISTSGASGTVTEADIGPAAVRQSGLDRHGHRCSPAGIASFFVAAGRPAKRGGLPPARPPDAMPLNRSASSSAPRSSVPHQARPGGSEVGGEGNRGGEAGEAPGKAACRSLGDACRTGARQPSRRRAGSTPNQVTGTQPGRRAAQASGGSRAHQLRSRPLPPLAAVSDVGCGFSVGEPVDRNERKR